MKVPPPGVRSEPPCGSCGGAGEDTQGLPRPSPTAKVSPTLLLCERLRLSALTFGVVGGRRTCCWFGRWKLTAGSPAGGAREEGGETAAHEDGVLLLVVGGPRVSHLAKALLLVADCMREYGACFLCTRSGNKQRRGAKDAEGVGGKGAHHLS